MDKKSYEYVYQKYIVLQMVTLIRKTLEYKYPLKVKERKFY